MENREAITSLSHQIVFFLGQNMVCEFESILKEMMYKWRAGQLNGNVILTRAKSEPGDQQLG